MSDRKLQNKWEKTLGRHGLSVIQPITDNSEGEMAQLDQRDDDNTTLRKLLGGDDQFMSGYQIQKIRDKDRDIPDWVFNDRKIQTMIMTAFPKFQSNSKQKARAGKWVRIIHLYYRMNLPRQIVAKEMNLEMPKLNRDLQRINWLANGYEWNGSKAGIRKLVSPQTPLEGTGEKGDETK